MARRPARPGANPGKKTEKTTWLLQEDEELPLACARLVVLAVGARRNFGSVLICAARER